MVRTLKMVALAAVLTACAGRDWRRAQALNTGEAYRSFVAANPGSGRVSEARQRAEALDWASAQRADTPEAYGTYVGAHPDGAHAAAARARAEELAWAGAEAAGTPEALTAFLATFPQSAREAEAEQRIEEAWHDLAVREDTDEAWGRYLVRYPDGRWAAEARKARDEAGWARAVQAATRDGYERYLQRFERGAYRLDAVDWLDRLRVTNLQPVVVLRTADVPAARRADLALAVRKEVDASIVADLRRDFLVRRTIMADLRGPAPHPQDAYKVPADTGILVVTYDEKRGAELDPYGFATDITAQVQLYCPPTRKPVVDETITASTPLPVQGTDEGVLHDSALEALGERLRSLVDDVITVREEPR